jgi:hypothetical protein
MGAGSTDEFMELSQAFFLSTAYSINSFAEKKTEFKFPVIEFKQRRTLEEEKELEKARIDIIKALLDLSDKEGPGTGANRTPEELIGESASARAKELSDKIPYGTFGGASGTDHVALHESVLGSNSKYYLITHELLHIIRTQIKPDETNAGYTALDQLVKHAENANSSSILLPAETIEFFPEMNFIIAKQIFRNTKHYEQLKRDTFDRKNMYLALKRSHKYIKNDLDGLLKETTKLYAEFFNDLRIHVCA